MGRSDLYHQPKLIDALAPYPENFGWVQAVVAAGQGIAKVVPGLVKKAEYDEKGAKLDYIQAKKKYEKAKSPTTKARAKRRMLRAQEAFELMRLQTILAGRGIVGEGPVTEFRRNFLFEKWNEAEEGSTDKEDLYKQIAKYDKRLKRLKREADMLAKAGYGSMTQDSVNAFPNGQGAPFPPPRNAGKEVY